MMNRILLILIVLFSLCSCEKVVEQKTYKIIKKEIIPEHKVTEYPSEYCVFCGEFVMVPEMHLTHMAFHNPKKVIKTIPTEYKFTLNNNQEQYVSKKQFYSKHINDTVIVEETYYK